jgi:hypothetical protein
MDIAERTLQLKADFDGVYEAGKKAEYNEFWDNFNKGNGSAQWDFRYAGTGWCKANFRPTEDIVCSARTFARHGWNRADVYDLAEHLDNLGVKIIKMTSARETFLYCTMFSRLPEIDASSCTYFYDTFYGMTRLVTIDKFVVNTDNATNWSGALFDNCVKLVNINMEGSIIGKSISFSVCPLSVESIKNIISCLKDCSGTDSEYKYTVTFKTSAFNVLESEGATAEYNGVACTWAELIDNKKWNLVKG